MLRVKDARSSIDEIDPSVVQAAEGSPLLPKQVIVFARQDRDLRQLAQGDDLVPLHLFLFAQTEPGILKDAVRGIGAGVEDLEGHYDRLPRVRTAWISCSGGSTGRMGKKRLDQQAQITDWQEIHGDGDQDG